MIHAFDKIYLDDAVSEMACMLDYGINRLGIPVRAFYDMFLESDISQFMSEGNPTYVGGKSGVELCFDVLEQHDIHPDYVEQSISLSRSREYWTGWAIAHYQWYSGMSYSTIDNEVPIEDIRNMYEVYHEMDITRFYESMEKERQVRRLETYLKLYREKCGYSQRELAELSKVPLRTIQQYEQRQKNINHARAEYVINLSAVLGCQPRELME